LSDCPLSRYGLGTCYILAAGRAKCNPFESKSGGGAQKLSFFIAKSIVLC